MYRCPACRTRRKDYGLFLKHLQASGHKLCDCGGYHYKHRPGSPFCKQNPISMLNDADRQGATEEELLDIKIEIALTTRNISTDCPF